ncbi:tetratricopeptide repeat protein 14 homolog isoform X3 [Aethina tumida]|uniref:tetratricopeptide repeat protein 14 homolog isoform X3 n=1 Tax=Aethina tumida TaxID=116153 RepID=UPI002147B7A3|nr:tetratricopeptide repeat protein 14 homolog isoform X3 [Aethina tumida]
MEQLNVQLLAKAMNFHGQQLQKMWEAEYGERDLAMRNISDLNFNVYGQRQKNLPFQDRGKRLKLHQFIVKNAARLYSMQTTAPRCPKREEQPGEDLYAVMPPVETFIGADRSKRLQYFTDNVKVGDLILGTIVSKQQSGMMLKVLCTTGVGANVRYAADINVKAFCPVASIIPAVDKKGTTRSYMMNDYVCCEVLEIVADTDKMLCGMKGVTRKPSDVDQPRPPLGLITTDDFPLAYKKALEHKNESYDALLEKSVGFNNPNNIQYLAEQMDVNNHKSVMKGLSGKFPENEYAGELRQVQASKWAYRNVADGIDHFKAGKHTEAFQCLNKALNIDPKNVEGLVARGALYANSGNFQRAIEDFETALKLNPNHANARKYMGETLVALGRSYEDDNKIEEARKAYQSCLTIIPYHEEAQSSLDFLKSKAPAAASSKNLIEPGELMLPNLGGQNSKSSTDVNDALKQLLREEEEGKKESSGKKKKGKKSKKRKNRHRSSSSSSSSSSGSDSSSSSSSSSSDSSSSSGDSDFKKKKKRRSRSHRREKQSSLSPLSKRMAMMDQSQDTTSNFNFNKPAAPATFDFDLQHGIEASTSKSAQPAYMDEYESKVRAFLDNTKDNLDYEDKVRKFLEESNKWKRKEGGSDKKKKKKKEKKAKKESRKKRKKDKLKRKSGGLDLSDFDTHKKLRDAIKKELSKDKHSKRHQAGSDDDEYLFQKTGYTKRFFESLPDLEELESKLNAYYALEKDSKRLSANFRSDSESPRRGAAADDLLQSPSPTREQKARQTVADAAASAGKWKMHIGPGTSGKNGSMDESPIHGRGGMKSHQMPPTAAEKAQSVRKQMEKTMKDVPGTSNKQRAIETPPIPMGIPPGIAKKLGVKGPLLAPVAPPKPMIPSGPVVLDKFGNFRLMTPPEMKKHDQPPLPPGRRPPEPPGRPRSDSRSPKRRSRSRSKMSRSRSTSMSRSRSRSYRSRSRSYYSRSRSRSGSYYSRSRSRSRSYSGDRRRYRRGGFRGRYNDRGTYYKPRFQNPRHNNNMRGRGGGGGGYYNNRDTREYRGGRGGGRPFNRPYNQRRPRGRFTRGGGGGQGYRDYRDRQSRYDRSRSRERSRSYSRSDSDDQTQNVKKSHVEKDADKVNKYADEVHENVRHEGPLSEGEDRDDYTGDNKVIDREAFDGKWADKDDIAPPGTRETPKKDIPADSKDDAEAS